MTDIREALGERGIKLRMLWLYGLGHISEWYRDVWKQDGGQRMCCDGHMCGCYGADYHSYWEWLWKSRGDRRARR